MTAAVKRDSKRRGVPHRASAGYGREKDAEPTADNHGEAAVQPYFLSQSQTYRRYSSVKSNSNEFMLILPGTSCPPPESFQRSHRSSQKQVGLWPRQSCMPLRRTMARFWFGFRATWDSNYTTLRLCTTLTSCPAAHWLPQLLECSVLLHRTIPQSPARGARAD